MFDIPVIDDLVKAVLFEAIGQTFAVVGMAVAKWSLGLFLLRLVNKTWHKVVIWIAMGSLMSASISVCFVFWLQCSPPAYLWDRRIDGGYCHINTTPVSFTLCSESFSNSLLFSSPSFFASEHEVYMRKHTLTLPPSQSSVSSSISSSPSSPGSSSGTST